MYLTGALLMLTILHQTYSDSSQLMKAYVKKVHSEENRARPQHRLSEAEWGSYNIREPEGPGTYAFGYDIEDAATGNVQFRQEERLANGTVIGSYGHVEPTGNVHIVHYIADGMGYRATIENSHDMNNQKEEIQNNVPGQDIAPSTPSPLLAAAIVSQQLLNKEQKVQESHWRPADKPQAARKSNAALTKSAYRPSYPQGGKYSFYYVPNNFYQNSFK